MSNLGARPISDFAGNLNHDLIEYAKTMEVAESPFRPLDCFLVIEKVEKQEKTSWGFILPEEDKYEKEREIIGLVLAAGPGYLTEYGSGNKRVYGKLVPNEIKRGDIVYFLERAARQTEFDGKKYYLLESHLVYFTISKDTEELTVET